MSILPDWKIRELAKAGMITPFEREFGLSLYDGVGAIDARKNRSSLNMHLAKQTISLDVIYNKSTQVKLFAKVLKS